MLAFHILFGLTGCTAVAALSAANFNISTATLQTLGCGTTCQAIFTAAEDEDIALFGTEFDSSFYATANNFSGSVPGDLLKVEPVNASTLSVISGMSAYRYQYTSRDLNGTLVPATGFIGLPYTSFRKDKKYPVIAYAHGTIGVFTGCPPSTTSSLYDYNSWSLLVENGYAIVAPDYAGLGNNYTEHKYLSFPAHANDLYYGMIAARKVFPALFTHEWASVGHSQGGGAVWKLSESDSIKTGAAGKYIGTVALAPASRIFDMTVLAADTILQSASYASYDVVYESLWLPIALRRVFPAANLSFFAEKFLNRVEIATIAQSCYYGTLSLGYDLAPNEILASPSLLENNTDFQKWQEMVAPANGSKAEQPLLIIQGLNDTAVLPQITINSYHDTCHHGNEAHLSLYPGMDHSDVLTASSPEWLAFLRALFNNQFSRGKCSKIVRHPFDETHMVTESETTEVTSL
ncbi:Alpha/Beta hydrolase protein [Penicillium sp. IBT 18751x]|nr:Alpha/Beta hydrolase protein [Penicillium sp. IBT 18751x]